MRRWHLLMLLLVLPSFWMPGHAAQPQESVKLVFHRERQFRIPFNPENAQRIRQLQLFVSTDQGHKWEPFAVAPPEQRAFYFVSQADGMYWFAVQTIDIEGRAYPPSMEGAQPSLKVVVDTLPPIVNLRALPPRGGEVGVAWEIRDDYLDLNLPDAIQLEYRPVGGTVWTPIVRRGEGSQLFFSPETNSTLEVRLRARDRAGNVGEATTNVSPAAQGGLPTAGQGVAPDNKAGGQIQGPVDPERRLINSKTVSLSFEIKDKGPSGISALELWYTQDGRSWNKYPLPKPADEQGFTSPLSFAVAGEGVYGFTLVARSGVGLGERAPQIGDRPQVWVEVDLTKPEVQVGPVVVGQGPEKGKLSIAWKASDKNLAQAPISLSYAQQAAGPWTPITTERIANTGRYIWSMPPGVPYQFLVRVEAVDQAGNAGEAVTTEMVKVDLLQPKARILNVEPGK
ncbi:MAG TPA: hypothetical protein VEL76_25570 [Gemmataceae bacterium]|nr:hypothetical protein [Gemmataceae bacterium]